MNDDAEVELERVKHARKYLRLVHKDITKLYGKQCPDYDRNCILCKLHGMVIELDKELAGTEKDFREELM